MAQKEKVSVTLNEGVAREIRQRAGEGHVSEWLNEAAVLRLQSDRLEQHMRALGIKLTAKEIADVAAAWPED